MKEVIFTGAATALITPFKNDKVDYDTFEKILEKQIAEGIDSVVVCGTTGEGSTLSDAEHKEVLDFCIKKINHRIPVIAGTGSNDTNYAIGLSTYAKKAGADALLLITPYYNKTTQRGLVAHFNTIADAVKMPCILYNVPSRTGVAIKPETYYELSKNQNIVAFKEANGDVSSMIKTMNLVGDNLTMYSGNDDQIVPVMSLGGKGVISVLSNIFPKETHNICQLFFDGKIKESLAEQLKYLDLINALFCEVNPIPVKTAMSYLGYCTGEMRLPLYPMEESNKEKLISELKKVL